MGPGICCDVALIRDPIATTHMRHLTSVNAALFVRDTLATLVRHVKRVRLVNPNARWLSTLAVRTNFIIIVMFNIPKTFSDKIVVPKDVPKVRKHLLRKSKSRYHAT